MGREQDGVNMLRNPNRRAERARRATETVKKAIPDLLRACPRARHGIHKADLIHDPPAATPTPDVWTTLAPGPLPKIRLQCMDTLTAAGRLSDRPFASLRRAPTLSTSKRKPNVAVLNMASPLRPGGGFLEGANSQEEFLCTRTTLYPSLWDSFYPLPDVGGVWTPDVLVFRDTTPEANDLEKRDRFFVDVISAGTLRFQGIRGRSEERLEGGCSCGMSYCDRDRDLVIRKMKAVLRIAQSQGVERLILGAWGCGAYGNPVQEVAKIWRKVIAGGQRQRKPNAERWEGIKEIIFAIPDRTMLREFELAFKDVLAMNAPSPRADDVDGDFKPNENDANNADLMSKIAEMELQMEQCYNSRMKVRLREELAVYRKELAQGLAAKAIKDDDPTNEEDEEADAEYVMSGYPPSDGEENSIYNFDENDVASESSECPTSEVFEFRAHVPGSGLNTRVSGEGTEDSPNDDDFYTLLPPSEQYNNETGWFSGSIDQLQDYLKIHGQISGSRTSPRSPEVRPDSSHLDVDQLDSRPVGSTAFCRSYGQD